MKGGTLHSLYLVGRPSSPAVHVHPLQLPGSPQPANPILALSEKFYSGYYASSSRYRPEDSTLPLLVLQLPRPPPHCFSLYSHFVSFLPYLRSSGYIYIRIRLTPSRVTRFSPHFRGEGGEHNIITISNSRSYEFV